MDFQIKIQKKKKIFEKKYFFEYRFWSTIKIAIFKSFQNYRWKFFNSWFCWKFYTEKHKTGLLKKLIFKDMWCHIHIWRHKMSIKWDVTSYLLTFSFIENALYHHFKYEIEWAINKLSTMILKIFKN